MSRYRHGFDRTFQTPHGYQICAFYVVSILLIQLPFRSVLSCPIVVGILTLCDHRMAILLS
jgi:hypothetical protein